MLGTRAMSVISLSVFQDSIFKNGLLQFQQKSTWYTFQDWSPSGLICPKYNQIELHNIDLFGTTG